MFSNIVIWAKLVVVLLIAVEIFSRLVNPDDAEWFKGKPRTMMILFFTVGMFCHNVWILYAVMIAYLPMVSRSRGEAAALMVVGLNSVPELASFIVAGGSLIMQIDKFLCMSLGLLFVFLRFPKTGIRANGYFDIPFLLLCALEFTSARDLNFTSTVRVCLVTILTVGMPYFLLTRSITRVEDLRRVMMSLCFVGFVLGCVGIFEALAHFLPYMELYRTLGLATGPTAYKIRSGILRSVTSFGETTSFAVNMGIMFMATIACRFSFKSTSKLVIALTIIAGAIFVTSSRNAWIGLIVAIVAFDFFRGRVASFFGKITVLGMAYSIAGLAAQFSTYMASMMGKSADSAGTADYRQRLLTRGLEEFMKHPIAGLSPAQVMESMADLRQGEGIVDFVNGYIYYMLVAGFGGLVALLLAFTMPAIAMATTRKRRMIEGLPLDRYGAFAAAVCISFMITTAFTAFGGRNSSNLYIVLAVMSVLYAWRRVPPEMLSSTARLSTKTRPLGRLFGSDAAGGRPETAAIGAGR